jgi:D-tyrosyl-tRNA(Tyr) deacylase
VGEVIELALYRLDDAGVAVTGIHYADAAAEIDETVAIDIGDYGPLGVGHGDLGDGRNPSRHRACAPREKRTALRTGNLGLEMDDAGH